MALIISYGMAAADLATQGVRLSAVMLLTWFVWTITVSATEIFKVIFRPRSVLLQFREKLLTCLPNNFLSHLQIPQ